MPNTSFAAESVVVTRDGYTLFVIPMFVGNPVVVTMVVVPS